MAFGFGAFFRQYCADSAVVQINLGYTATWAGYLTATMGFGGLTMSPVVAKLATKYDQRALASFGLSIILGRGDADAFIPGPQMQTFWHWHCRKSLQGLLLPFSLFPVKYGTYHLCCHEMASAAGLMNF